MISVAVRAAALAFGQECDVPINQPKPMARRPARKRLELVLLNGILPGGVHRAGRKARA
jgi:hypothetical protein